MKSADEVIALDVSPALLKSRLRSGKVVRPEDVERALGGAFSDRTLYVLRELLLRTIDELTIPAVSAGSVSTAAALVLPGVPIEPFLERTARNRARARSAVADLLSAVGSAGRCRTDRARLGRRSADAAISPRNSANIAELRASLIAVPLSPLASKLANQRLDRDVFIAGIGQTFLDRSAPAEERTARVFGDRSRAGYGKLTVFLGPAAGSGKTYAMLDRAHQLKSEGVDVVRGFIETHGRKETAALLEGLEVIAAQDASPPAASPTRKWIATRSSRASRKSCSSTNSRIPTRRGSQAHKRYEDVLAILRAGIDVLTTLNVQHLEALTDAVLRLTGTDVRETLPDEILTLADEVVLIDVTPETLRERLREGKIYPPERIDAALSNFFRVNNLRALRELAVREAIAAKDRARLRAPFERLLLTVAPRASDAPFIERCAKIARRLGTEFAVVCVTGATEHAGR